MSSGRVSPSLSESSQDVFALQQTRLNQTRVSQRQACSLGSSAMNPIRSYDGATAPQDYNPISQMVNFAGHFLQSGAKKQVITFDDDAEFVVEYRKKSGPVFKVSREIGFKIATDRVLRNFGQMVSAEFKSNLSTSLGYLQTACKTANLDSSPKNERLFDDAVETLRECITILHYGANIECIELQKLGDYSYMCMMEYISALETICKFDALKRHLESSDSAFDFKWDAIRIHEDAMNATKRKENQLASSALAAYQAERDAQEQNSKFQSMLSHNSALTDRNCSLEQQINEVEQRAANAQHQLEMLRRQQSQRPQQWTSMAQMESAFEQSRVQNSFDQQKAALLRPDASSSSSSISVRSQESPLATMAQMENSLKDADYPEDFQA